MTEQAIDIGWTLRAGRLEDVPAMYALDVVCFDEPFQFDQASMQRFVERAGAIVVMCERGSELAGFVIVHQEPGHRGYVVTLNVAPAHRRKGLARSLVIEAERQAFAAGVERMTLHVFVGNAEAISFYARLGYTRKELDRGFYGTGRDAFACTKELGQAG